MIPATDYRIYQRGADGCADILFSGKVPAEVPGSCIWARALREDDNMAMTDWLPCAVEGDGWSITFTLPAGGPYWLEARKGDEGANIEWCRRIGRVRHIGVGEVFMLAGQSNMAGYGRDAAYDPPELGVHLYGNNGKWAIAAHPLNDSLDTIYPENAEYPTNSSPALSFARMLRKRLNMPIGLVQASLGGSPLRAWNPEEDGTLYRAMVRRLDAVERVGGMLWYQGCSDTDTPEQADTYLARFTRSVELWREALGDIPIVTVQLNRRATDSETDEPDRRWGQVCEAQRQAALTIDKLVVVPASDLGCTDGIHNSAGSNVILGERMAHAALSAFYGQPGFAAPNLRRAVLIDPTHIRLEFDSGMQMRPAESIDRGMDVEDAQGMVNCFGGTSGNGYFTMTLPREVTLPARLHAYWRSRKPDFLARDLRGMPMLSCYGVEIVKG